MHLYKGTAIWTFITQLPLHIQFQYDHSNFYNLFISSLSLLEYKTLHKNSKTNKGGIF